MEDKGRGRADPLEQEEDLAMKEGITTLVGAALGEQQCWERTACKAGEYASTIPGKSRRCDGSDSRCGGPGVAHLALGHTALDSNPGASQKME